jgi:hypothetical protein
MQCPRCGLPRVCWCAYKGVGDRRLLSPRAFGRTATGERHDCHRLQRRRHRDHRHRHRSRRTAASPAAHFGLLSARHSRDTNRVACASFLRSCARIGCVRCVFSTLRPVGAVPVGLAQCSPIRFVRTCEFPCCLTGVFGAQYRSRGQIKVKALEYFDMRMFKNIMCDQPRHLVGARCAVLERNSHLHEPDHGV